MVRSLFEDPRQIFPGARRKVWGPHYCLKLGPPIRPPQTVTNGVGIYRNARVWCMLDLLLTSRTITKARVETKRRMEHAG